MNALAPHPGSGEREAGRYAARIRQIRLEAEGVISVDLLPRDGTHRNWQPGAHIDLHLPSGQVRQYSLCNAPEDGFYRIAVLRQSDGRGGSREVHDGLCVGQTVHVSAPRNNFELRAAGRYLFVAGGIGIAPILPMVMAANRAGADWHLIYGGRTTETMAFRATLADLDPDRITLRTDAEQGPIDPAGVLAASGISSVYACGPQGLLDVLDETFAAAGRAHDLNLERFAAGAKPLPGDGFVRVHLARSGGHVDVGRDQSILTALREAGIEVASSCEQGFCGTCETRVLAGNPDHRDDLLSEEERARGDVMMLCVSKARSAELTLDL